MKSIAAFATVFGVIALAGTAIGDPGQAVIERQGLMKEIVAPNMRLGASFVKEQVPFDAAEAAAAMTAVSEVPEKFAALFPEGTSADDHPDTTASPIIWVEMDDFNARLATLQEVSVAASQSASEGLDSFRSAFGQVARQCSACHQNYRVD